MLYVTSGDGTSDSDTDLAGQDMTRLTAKVLRIDVDHPADGKAYSVPADNPFVGQKHEGTPIRPETWAYGLRNPWRICVDRATGAIWVGNNGQDLWEQAYRLERGANYGWSVMEGGHVFYADRRRGPTPLVPPTVEHPHSVARSLTGGVVYRGQRLPELHGAYIYGDYSTGKIWGVLHDGKRIVWHKELADTTLAITAFGIDRDGELLICDHRGGGEGGLFRLEPTPKGAGAAAISRASSARRDFFNRSPRISSRRARFRIRSIRRCGPTERTKSGIWSSRRARRNSTTQRSPTKQRNPTLRQKPTQRRESISCHAVAGISPTAPCW